jgi:hypothetical protein
LLFSTPLLLMFFSIILLMIPTFICAHCFVLPFPLLFVVVFNCIIYTHIVMNSKTSKMHTTFSNKLKLFLMITSFFLILEHSACHIHFLSTCHFLIKTWSSKLIWPITTSLCVPYTTTWEHLTSSLWMNVVNFIFWLLHICNLPTFTLFTMYTFC